MGKYDFMSMPPSPFAEPAVKASYEKLIRIWEKLRDMNTGGYGGDVLVGIANPGWPSPGGSHKTSCSPFTGTVLGMLFSESDDPPYKPVFNGSDPLPGHFYWLQNGDLKTSADFVKKNGVKVSEWRLDNTLTDSAGAPCWFGLADPIGRCDTNGREGHPEKMRRGDLLKIEWGAPSHGGHATFCWDVHLDKDGNVDAFQYISANGVHPGGGVGISVGTCTADGVYVKKNGDKYSKAKPNFINVLDGNEYTDYVEERHWFAMPDLKKGAVDLTTFKTSGPKKKPTVYYAGGSFYPREIKIARIRGIVAPEPGAAPAPSPKSDDDDTHFTVTPTKVSGEQKQDPAPAESKQKDDAPTSFQADVEKYLRIFFAAKWIESDPGDSDNVNDDKSQAAIKEFQKKYTKLDANGVADADTRKQLAGLAEYALKQQDIEQHLRALKDAGVIEADPGTPDSERDEQSTKALTEFQSLKGLDADGIPGPKTLKALESAVAKLSQPAKSDQPSGPCPNEMDLRVKIIEVAKGEVGMKCDASYNDANDRIPYYFKTAFDIDGMKDAYCAAFAAHCWVKAGVQLKFDKGDKWVPTLYEHFKRMGRIVEPGGAANVGDLVFVQSKDGGQSDKDASKWPHHVGLVAEMDGAKLLKTIEGNWNPGDGVSGVYVVDPANYYDNRICAYGSLTGQAAEAQKDEPAEADAPAEGDAPAEDAAPAAPPQPALLWGTNDGEAGLTVDLRLFAANLDPKAPAPQVMLIDSTGNKTAALAAQEKPFLSFANFLQIFITVPHAADGARFKAMVSAPILGGTRVDVTTDDEMVVSVHQCAVCDDLKSAIKDDADFAAKVHTKSSETRAVKAVQNSLIKLGADLGKSGADGQYGETGAHALRYFLREASGDDAVFQKMSPLKPSKDAPMLSHFLEKCATNFKVTWPKKAPPPSNAAPDPQLPEIRPLPPITGSGITVGGKDFVDWFNKDFHPPRKNVKLGIPNANGKDTTLFENPIVGDNFRKVFDSIAILSGRDDTPLAEFVAFFCVFYNEEGGKFIPEVEAHSKDELNNFKYLFKEVDGGKVSYNRAHNKQKLAGDQLLARGAIGASEKDTWNAPSPFPESAYKSELKDALRECDFYKFQGRGLTQITWREAYGKYVAPALKEAGGYETDLDKITTDELERAFQDPKVYLRAVFHEWHAGQVGNALPEVNNDPPEFFWVGYHIGGTGNYGSVYHTRCMELYREMIAGNYSMGGAAPAPAPAPAGETDSDTGRLSVQLLDSDSNPIAGTAYKLTGPGQKLSGKSDAEGVLTHEGVPIDYYELSVKGYAAVDVPASADPDDVFVAHLKGA